MRTSDIGVSDAANGTFQVFASVNSQPEPGFAKTANTGSGTMEVHADFFSNGTYRRGVDATGGFSPGDVANGTFMLNR
jgi:hypothetical protein